MVSLVSLVCEKCFLEDDAFQRWKISVAEKCASLRLEQKEPHWLSLLLSQELKQIEEATLKVQLLV